VSIVFTATNEGNSQRSRVACEDRREEGRRALWALAVPIIFVTMQYLREVSVLSVEAGPQQDLQ
jgi:hypothetical protein